MQYFVFEREVIHILRLKALSVALISCLTFFLVSPTVEAAYFDNYETQQERFARYEMMWNNASDSERFFMDTAVKAHACGLSVDDFKFFARVVEGEGKDSDDDITDKVLIAVTVLNRTNCSSWPTSRVISTLKRPGQFEVVDRETGECNCARSLDSEWAIVMAYRLQAENTIDRHMVYYNAIGFTGYSREFADYAYFGGNYFSCRLCDCDYCTELDPDWCYDDVEMLDDSYIVLRPDGVGPNYF